VRKVRQVSLANRHDDTHIPGLVFKWDVVPKASAKFEHISAGLVHHRHLIAVARASDTFGIILQGCGACLR
jgi:hypothetical protein